MLIVDRDGSISHQTRSVRQSWTLKRINAAFKQTIVWVTTRSGHILARANAHQHVRSRTEHCIAHHQPACGC